ncbi:hypothetical protein K2173_014808 [Erythroxylum novogranatense]|uniref:Uncharacterized protein n=1 Tax=Erythroxylum novogranatense TaxID=1862640 RepID=A0AAV8TFL6_9ROSI|nr:hypothetical protein K2173_014808 [Erythroxylum novogranatense]
MRAFEEEAKNLGGEIRRSEEMSTKKPSIYRNLCKVVKAPIKMLAMAKDVYVRGMTVYSQRLSGVTFGCPTAHQVTPLSRSSSVCKTSNRGEDYRELVKAAVSKQNVEIDHNLKRQEPNINSANKVNRSRSVGIPRIDEDRSFRVEDDFQVNVDLFTRSRSHAVPRRNFGFF